MKYILEQAFQNINDSFLNEFYVTTFSLLPLKDCITMDNIGVSGSGSASDDKKNGGNSGVMQGRAF